MEEQITPQAAAELLEADKQRRADRVAQVVRAALLEQRCELVALPQINADGRIVAVVQIVPR